ncbi:unnamed protein product [Lymnaea stagnalis]|uniref:Uncharacterized protein n=1 Tax=Lymnaea stagnalis TaxID=6523 RepID=A0AAV2HBN8_LYMST
MTNFTSSSVRGRNPACCSGINLKGCNACSRLHNANSETTCRPTMAAESPRRERPVACDDVGSSWAFIQKIMAVDEKHDRRKKERQRQKALLEQSLNGASSNLLPNSNSKLADTLSRWLRDQVLDDDNPEENESSDVYDDGLDPDQPTLSLGPLEPTNGASKAAKASLPRLPIINTTEVPDINAPSSPTSSWDKRSWSSLPRISTSTPNFLDQAAYQEDDCGSPKPKKKRQLRLPPILLPRVYTIQPRPLRYREFLTPTNIRGPITDSEWEELQDCRYIRKGVARFSLQLSPSRMSSSLPF